MCAPPPDAVDAPTPAATVLGGRYRLLEPVGETGTLWRGRDEVLDRPVAIRLVPVSRVTQARQLSSALERASRVSDARFARLLDASVRERPAWVVREWVSGPSLAERVAREPLPVAAAVALAREVDAALSRAAECGVRPAGLRPEQVFLDDGDASVRIADLGLAAPAAEPAARELQVGALLYAALSGRWPLASRCALPRAPEQGGAPVAVRELRAEVPRQLDALVSRLLRRPGATTATGADPAVLLSQVAEQLTSRAGPTVPAAARRAARLLVLWGLPLAVLAVVGVLGWRAGVHLGTLPGQPNTPVLAQPAGAGGARPTHVPYPIVAVRDYDPQGDGTENPDQAPLAVDSDPTTAWMTQLYRGSPQFGGLKKGVGLLVDLGTAKPVREVQVAFTTAGGSFEVMAGASPAIDPKTAPVLASDDSPSTSATVTVRPTTARYWLIWLTSLPPVSGGYQQGIAEVELLS